MKVYERKKLIKRLKVCLVFGIILALISVGVTIGLAYFVGEATFGDMFVGAGLFVFLSAVYTLAIFGSSFNFGKMILGFIAPIPILSCVIECIKSWVYAIKGIIVIIKRQDQLVIGSEPISEEDSDD